MNPPISLTLFRPCKIINQATHLRIECHLKNWSPLDYLFTTYKQFPDCVHNHNLLCQLHTQRAQVYVLRSQ